MRFQANRAVTTALLGLCVSSAFCATTAENLKTAYKGETTAVAKYKAFAGKADQEGFAYVACLFRAASAAEEIHARNHGSALKKLGVTPSAGSFKEPVGTTRENLQTAIEGETYESDHMYPVMLAQAKADHNQDAVRSIVYALNAEGSHAELYKRALKDIEQGKKQPATLFLVCPRCGETFRSSAPSECPVCATPNKEFLRIRPHKAGVK